MIGIGMEKFERKIHSWINTNQRSAINCIRKRGEEELGLPCAQRRGRQLGKSHIEPLLVPAKLIE